ncbi:unnamed protein product [Moneuplotes crassus]|uniref:Uncharacterized protein n=1 Tax=Euplotes crassus TaxID=5936 RepID=A0AAD1U3W3_EUPCR|nr:unnamed protein product [Moneuplotes crassus]
MKSKIGSSMLSQERFNAKLIQIRKLKDIANVNEMKEKKKHCTNTTKRKKRDSLSSIPGINNNFSIKNERLTGYLGLAPPEQKLFSRNLNLWLRLKKRKINRSFHPSKNKAAVASKKTYYTKNAIKYINNSKEKNHVHDFMKSLSVRKSLGEPSSQQPFMTEVKVPQTSRRNRGDGYFKDVVSKINNRVEKLTDHNFHKIILDSYQKKLDENPFRLTLKTDEDNDCKLEKMPASVKECYQIIQKSKKNLPKSSSKTPNQSIRSSKSLQCKKGKFRMKGKIYPLSPSIDRVLSEVRKEKFNKQKMLTHINKKIMHTKFPSTKFIKEDFDEFVPDCFKDRILNHDTSYESEEENPMHRLKKEEANEFYNIVRNIFSSANISLKNEQLYSPFLEALIKNYSVRLSNINNENSNSKKLEKKETYAGSMSPMSPGFKYQTKQVHLLDMKSSRSISEIRSAQEQRRDEYPLKFLGPDKNELDSKNIRKIYKNELRMRNHEKDFHPLDKLCMEIMGPQGSKEWLSNDIDFIDDVLSKKTYQSMKKRRFMNSREKQRDQDREKYEPKVCEDMLDCIKTLS